MVMIQERLGETPQTFPNTQLMPCSFPFMSCCWHWDFPQPQSFFYLCWKDGLLQSTWVALTKNVLRTSSGGDNRNHQFQHKGSLPHSAQSARPWTHNNDRNTCCFQDISTPRPLALVTGALTSREGSTPGKPSGVCKERYLGAVRRNNIIVPGGSVLTLCWLLRWALCVYSLNH